MSADLPEDLLLAEELVAEVTGRRCDAIWGFHKMGDTPIAGWFCMENPMKIMVWYEKSYENGWFSPIDWWFLLGKIPIYKWMMTGGTPILGNLHLFAGENGHLIAILWCVCVFMISMELFGFYGFNAIWIPYEELGVTWNYDSNMVIQWQLWKFSSKNDGFRMFWPLKWWYNQ